MFGAIVVAFFHQLFSALGSACFSTLLLLWHFAVDHILYDCFLSSNFFGSHCCCCCCSWWQHRLTLSHGFNGSPCSCCISLCSHRTDDFPRCPQTTSDASVARFSLSLSSLSLPRYDPAGNMPWGRHWNIRNETIAKHEQSKRGRQSNVQMFYTLQNMALF